MSRRPRRNHSAVFKAKVAMDALRDGQTIAEVAQRHDVHPNQVTEWRRQLQERAADVFGGVATPTAPWISVLMFIIASVLAFGTIEGRTPGLHDALHGTATAGL